MPPRPHQPLMLRLALRGMVLLVCFSLGMHSALLQGIAWTGMLISFAREGPMIEAVQKTFDGQHACALCQVVKENRDSNPKQPQQAGQSLKKIDAVLVELTRLIAPAAEMISFAIIREEGVKRHEQPEMPPPRHVLA